MKRTLLCFCCTFLFCISVSAQETLYPVRGNLSGLETMHIEVDPHQRDHARFIAEKTFEYTLTVEFPTKEEAGFLPSSDAKITMLWLRVENHAKQPLNVNVSTFTLTDEQGHSYRLLPPEDAFQQIMDATAGRRNFLSNTTRPLGHSGATAEELKDETLRFSFRSGAVDPEGFKEGLLFFEVPQRKKFTLSLRLGELWSRPFVFTNVKPKN